MNGLEHLGKGLIIIGSFMVFFGILLWLTGRSDVFSWFGKLPGDIELRGKNYAIYIPIVTSLILSLVLTLLLNLIFWIKR